ncbi:MAG: GFA family protein [Candidatus Zeuxoniibacter abyssi]|nr:MAG: GFA family protein [Candidatus Persebacteraceae bacterium AB1(2)]
MNTNTKILSGGCLCRAVRFEISPPMRNIVACHCTQCRKSGGHYLAATAVAPENWTLLEEKGLRWFQSSQKARRGFCYLCGGSLFGRPNPATEYLFLPALWMTPQTCV